MSTIINGSTDAITFPDATIQNTSAIVSGKVPYSVLPTGSVLQVVSATYSTSTSTSSATSTTTGLTATITPKFSTSKILAIANLGACYTSASGAQGTFYLFKNGSALTVANAQFYSNNSAIEANQNITYLDSPASTSATTYAVFFNANNGTVYISLNGTLSTLTLMEIAG